MKTIEYNIQGETFADLICEQQAREWLSHPGDDTIVVGTDTFITAVRVLICDGFIPHTEVQFIYDGQPIQPDADGRLPVWPAGFCDTELLLCSRLLSGRSTG